jgi:hypothetical protein
MPCKPTPTAESLELSDDTDISSDKMELLESIIIKITSIQSPNGDCDIVEETESDSESDEDEGDIDEMYDSLIQMEYDDIIEQQMEEYRKKK